MVVSDLLMLTSLDFSRAYRGFWSEAPGLPQAQISGGYYLGELTIPFYSIGGWHLSMAVRPAGRWAHAGAGGEDEESPGGGKGARALGRFGAWALRAGDGSARRIGDSPAPSRRVVPQLAPDLGSEDEAPMRPSAWANTSPISP